MAVAVKGEGNGGERKKKEGIELEERILKRRGRYRGEKRGEKRRMKKRKDSEDGKE